MKNLKIIGFFAIFILLSLFIFMPVQVQAVYNPTLSSVGMTNYVIVTGANFLFVRSSIFTTNKAINGGGWSCTNYFDHALVAGATISNHTFLTNLGNTNWNFQIGVISNFRNNVNKGYFQWSIYTNVGLAFAQAGATVVNGANRNVFQRVFSPGSSLAVTLVVSISNSFGSATNCLRLFCSNATCIPSGAKTNYTGDNGTQYGGTFGWGWGTARANCGSSMNDLFCIQNQNGVASHAISGNIATEAIYIAAAPIITITKTILNIRLNGVASAPIPGATITFDIKVTNTGGTANNVVVRDTMATNGMKFKGGSMTASSGVWNTNVVPLLGNPGMALYWTNRPSLPGVGALSGTHLEFKVIIE